MIRLRQAIFGAAWLVLILSVRAQNPPTPALSGTNSNVDLSRLTPPSPAAANNSPVAFFRQLLVMPVAERSQALANRTPESRARIQAKIREYLALDANERELRLRATELRWYLAPLLRVPAADRAARVAQVPEDLRGLVQARLAQWDLLTTNVQQELIANERTVPYFARLEPPNPATFTPQSQELTQQLNQLFELTPAEKQSTLNTLSPAERVAMEKTLQAFGELPPALRQQCMRNYAKFAGMSAAERAEFLKNAERWAQMSPQERQAWRELVSHVPMMPPMPAAVPRNLMPPAFTKPTRPTVATN